MVLWRLTGKTWHMPSSVAMMDWESEDCWLSTEQRGPARQGTPRKRSCATVSTLSVGVACSSAINGSTVPIRWDCSYSSEKLSSMSISCQAVIRRCSHRLSSPSFLSRLLPEPVQGTSRNNSGSPWFTDCRVRLIFRPTPFEPPVCSVYSSGRYKPPRFYAWWTDRSHESFHSPVKTSQWFLISERKLRYLDG